MTEDSEAQLPHPYSKRWAPYRDRRTGEVVTITGEQVMAVMHAVHVVDDVRAFEAERCGGEPHRLFDDIPGKSRALGRLLLDGKPLFEDLPPHFMGAAHYSLWDDENADHDRRNQHGSGRS